MKRETRYDYAAAVAMRYQRSGREQKGWILDEFCAATGYNRKYAIKLLRGPFPRAALPPGHGRPPVYGPEEVALLRPCWQIADYVCSKRLAPFLSELLGKLSACGELSDLDPELVARVAHMSPATIDRLLAPYRALPGGRGRSLTRPGSLLRNQVPIKTFADWNDARPGFLEIDLVAHCGSTSAGQFLSTLSTVDVATGWMLCRGVRNKGEERRSSRSWPRSDADCRFRSSAWTPTMVASSSTVRWSTTVKKSPSPSPVPGHTVRTTVATWSRKIGRWCAAWSATPASNRTRCQP